MIYGNSLSSTGAMAVRMVRNRVASLSTETDAGGTYVTPQDVSESTYGLSDAEKVAILAYASEFMRLPSLVDDVVRDVLMRLV